MGKFVKIISTRFINVTEGLQSIDKTNYANKVPNTYNINQMWVNSMILIKKGNHYYPAEIQEWNTVKNLAADDVITIAGEADESEIKNEEDLAYALETQKKLDNAHAKYQKEVTANNEQQKRSGSAKAKKELLGDAA